MAPVVAAIKHGNFLMLSDAYLDLLLRNMAGKNSTALETICISAAVISATDAKFLARLIKSSDVANIKRLKLDRDSISQQAFKIMFEAWKWNRTITSLSLVRSGVNDKVIKYLAKMIGKNNTLLELDLSNNRFTSQGVEVLCSELARHPSLTRLCLQSNSLKTAAAPFLANMLSKNRALLHLNVGSNRLGAMGCAMIAEAVRINTTLTSISLDMNEMGSQGAAAMARALDVNKTLTYLYLPNNNIGDQGLIILCKSLERNSTLIGLDLELNHIGYGQTVVGIEALGKALVSNHALREINLSYNTLSAAAIDALMEGVTANTTLESILFTNCGISTEGALSISKILPIATGLQNIGLTSNPDISVDGYWALATGLSKNRSVKGMQLDYNSEDRHVLYESIQHSLTRNYLWQQAVYSASCRILSFARVVLLGRYNDPRLLQQSSRRMSLNTRKHHGSPWKLLRKIKLGRTNSGRSTPSIPSSQKNQYGQEIGIEAEGRDDIIAPTIHLEPRAQGNAVQVPGAGNPSRDVSRTSSPAVSIRSLSVHSNSQSQRALGPRSGPSNMLLPFQQTLGFSPPSPCASLKNVKELALQRSRFESGTGDQDSYDHDESGYGAEEDEYEQIGGGVHRVMANLIRMPYEIFETICVFLDPGHTMTIAQIRVTLAVAGDRTT
ncbi:hypothetical protein BGW38_003396, partial [Lunasporangiospora selenospora]